MVSRRIIPCLDVRDGKVVKGVKFRDHRILGDILEFARRYRDQGADELVFYDIAASAEGRVVSRDWVGDTARLLDIPFCVAGGIRSVDDAREVLHAGADKISINSPALENPRLITDLATAFGSQCVVVGIDSLAEDGDYWVYQYTGSEVKVRSTRRRTLDWIKDVQKFGAGEIVLNCMSNDGVGQGYDLAQLKAARALSHVPLIASGGAGKPEHFEQVFRETGVEGALAAGVFHRGEIMIADLKKRLAESGIEVRQ
ncbi:MAG: imidazole glycerol phosphate synthase subunit HisF [Deltaproteobacteria bacterium]|nr:imidazole glycerol phosphate synthase subunit HisF [Deltaproteobacteria bacterium]